MNRRGFLKAIAAAPAALALPAFPAAAPVLGVSAIVATLKDQLTLEALEKIVNPPIIFEGNPHGNSCVRDRFIAGDLHWVDTEYGDRIVRQVTMPYRVLR